MIVLDILELKQKDQEIFKYRQMLERFDRIDSQNKMTQDLAEQKRNNLFTMNRNFTNSSNSSPFFDHKSAFASDQKEMNYKYKIKETIEVKQFPEDTNVRTDQEICKGCKIY